MKSASFFLILAALPALFLNCTSYLVKEMIRSAAVPNWIYIHSDPQVGDYALHETAQGAVVKYRVEATEQNRVVVTQRFVSLGTLIGSGLDDLQYRLITDRAGYVLKAYLEEDDGAVTILRTAHPGENGYIDQLTESPIVVPGSIDVPAGNFEITEVRCFEMESVGAWGPNKITVIHMGNSDVPFGIVKIMGYQSSELRLSDFASTIKDLGTALTVEFVLSKLEDKYSKIEAVLIEHGNDL